MKWRRISVTNRIPRQFPTGTERSLKRTPITSVCAEVTSLHRYRLCHDVTSQAQVNVVTSHRGRFYIDYIHIHLCRGDVTSQVQGDVTSQVQGDVTSQVQGDVTSQVQGDVTSQVQGDVTSQVEGARVNF